ncbi:hypothetical protein [Clostridium sp. JN-1]|uniref:hypothetical protein n=1 Tax=Clostridium sp. JN-1 TaxID=2483110 RepID=UPI000F0B96B1|nr:hypothetical protein [Clostridium sp. JN-1]
MSKCKKEFECGGNCWMNVAGDGAVWDVLSDHCTGTSKEQKLMDDFFNGRKNKEKVYAKFNLSEAEKLIIENN